jgi:hypothetical protein
MVDRGWFGNVREGDHRQNTGVSRWIILKMFFMN